MASIKTQLSAGLAISLVLLLSAQWLLVTLSIQRLLQDQLATRLSHDVESLLAGTRFDPDGRLAIDPDRVNVVYQRPLSGHYYLVRSDRQDQPSRSLWDASMEVPTVPVGESRRLRLAGPQDGMLFMLVESFRKQGRMLTIAVAEDTSALDAQMRRFAVLYGLLSAAVLGLLLYLQRRTVAASLRPLDRVRAELARLQRGEATRVSVDAPEEISPLVAELNRLVAAMAQRTQRSRLALGNLAHALKTQLAMLAQVSARPELHGMPELRRALESPVEASRRIVERELRRARVSGAPMPGEKVSVANELNALRDTLQRLYADKQLEISLDVSPQARFEGDREDLLELLGNLVDNACKFGSHRVAVSAVGFDAGLRLTVDDDGPGCDETQIEALTRRGFRADESLPGSGLGLAIARDVVESYGGRLSFRPSPDLGGLRVEAEIPATAITASASSAQSDSL